MITALFWIATGLFVGNVTEWLVHKYILHGLGKKRGSIWRSHFKVHHGRSRRNNFYDEDYDKPVMSNEPVRTEILGLALLILLNTPFVFLSVWYFLTVSIYAMVYFFIHRKSHLDTDWTKRHLPWHWDHHMGRDQEKNWCVTFPLADYIFGTRVKYLGTEQEREDTERRSKYKKRT